MFATASEMEFEMFSKMKTGTSQSCRSGRRINPLNAKLNPICHLLALLGAHHVLHVSRIRVKKI
jgi:hypothetical protein